MATLRLHRDVTSAFDRLRMREHVTDSRD